MEQNRVWRDGAFDIRLSALQGTRHSGGFLS
ncbi:hypothetical protein SAMN05421848_2043 [Kushneria avicenniae]|uniref:Uncharacterized protein n=1 Tax=Kushneria avicenniae TaxID=402385 RepID=A0A1I1KV82_9GAMM|nr:hypothetical protein SAMN05421848_2043 [Kushneria avicenniae]